ncbi:hypothetical protein [Rhodoferax aquaticus]|nr:hypothetical protein [Rhodoferax aquaticus]
MPRFHELLGVAQVDALLHKHVEEVGIAVAVMSRKLHPCMRHNIAQ